MKATHNIGDLNAALALYQQLRGLTTHDVLAKQAPKLSREIFHQLRGIRPEKGSIRANALARLKSGKGIKIRESVVETITAKWSDKFKAGQAKEEDKFWGESPGNINWKWKLRAKMVQREIGLRESGRGILSLSAKYGSVIPDSDKAISRYGQILSEFNIKVDDKSGMARFLWSGVSKQSQEVVGGLQRPRGSSAVKAAISIVTGDILEYTTRKQKELVVKAVKKMIKRA